MFFRHFFILTSIFYFALAQSDFEQGVSWYSNRHDGSSGINASNESIDKAIGYFSSALQSKEYENDAAVYLLKSYFYKAEYAIQDKDEKKDVFNKGKALGEKYIEKYPHSAEFRYWYLVNLGSWAKVYGILTAAREGVSDLMREHSNRIIELNPEYQDGGGYFMLGAIHYKSPYIPFLLSWPDNDEAIKYLQLSVNTGKATVSQKKYLAQALKKDGQKEKAKGLLIEITNSEPDLENLVEELNYIDEARQLLKDF